MEAVTDFIFLGSKIFADGDCSHEIKRCLPFGRKVMTNLDSVSKRQRHHFADKSLYSQSYVFFSSRVRAGPQKRLSADELMLLNCGAGEHS